MHRFAYVAAAATIFASAAAMAAERAPNNVGCGLGTLAWEGQSGQGAQILAGTTNATLGTQTFGITSGTSGCAKGGKVYRPDQLAMFIGPNMNRLAQDMAIGRGETLASVANLIGIAGEDQSAFFTATQRNFARIMPTDAVTAEDVANSLNAVLAEDPALKRYVLS